jgi:hypothetical protein
MITKVFIPQLVQRFFGINWFGFTGLFGSACLSTQAVKKGGKEKRCDDICLANITLTDLKKIPAGYPPNGLQSLYKFEV